MVVEYLNYTLYRYTVKCTAVILLCFLCELPQTVKPPYGPFWLSLSLQKLSSYESPNQLFIFIIEVFKSTDLKKSNQNIIF